MSTKKTAQSSRRLGSVRIVLASRLNSQRSIPASDGLNCDEKVDAIKPGLDCDEKIAALKTSNSPRLAMKLLEYCTL